MGDSGIIMLFTAGSDNQCTEAADPEPVAESTVRLMNVAFSAESDAELDELASETNGISYTVETSGILSLYWLHFHATYRCTFVDIRLS